MSNPLFPASFLITVLISTTPFCRADEPLATGNAEPPAIDADEPLTEKFSLVAAARYLDSAAISWQNTHQCSACHTMVSYMMARRALDPIAPMPTDVRTFFEEVATGQRDPMPDYQCHDVNGAVAITVAASLVLDGHHGAERLSMPARLALDRMWKLQREDGGWDWPFRDTPPLKLREHYGATLAAIAVGMAPDGYALSEPAKSGLAALAGYLNARPPETLHEETMLTWASIYVADLLKPDQRQEILERLMAAQRPDGGWSLASLVENPRAPATATAETAARLRAEAGYGEQFLVYAGRDAAYKTSLASDGYATGLAIYVARQAGIAASDERLRRGVAWLKPNQRASGRWFTPSQAWHTQNLIANAGTAYAVLALAACGEMPMAAQDEPPCVPLLSDDEAWEKLPPIEHGQRQPLPAWARALAESLPRTTAAMLELDRLHRAEYPLGLLLAGKLRLMAARANRCAYSASVAEADLRRAGLDDAGIASLDGDEPGVDSKERLALDFARRLTLEADAITDKEVARVAEAYGENGLVAIVLSAAYANFQDRLLLALGVSIEEAGPLPPLDVRFVKGEAAESATAPPRGAPTDQPPPGVPEIVDDPQWEALDFDALQRLLVSQRSREGRIRVPTWDEVSQTIPKDQRPDHPVRIRWSLVCRGYQPKLAAGWSACTRAFGDEAKQDRVFEESLFWVVTRSIHCFY